MTNTLRAVLRGGWTPAMLVVLLLGTPGVGGADVRAFKAGELMISVRTGTPRSQVDQLAAGVNATVVQAFGALNYEKTRETYHLRIAGGLQTADATTLAAVQTLKADPRVVWANPNRMYRFLDTPNDPQYAQQWHLPAMNMPNLWTLEKGKPSVLIAILDSGCDMTHPDLVARLHPGARNMVPGGNVNDLTEAQAHGTMVLGTAGAATNNAVGVAGVSWQGVRMLPIKVGDVSGISGDAIINGMLYAQSLGADVINLSLGSVAPFDDPDLLDAQDGLILSLARQGIVFTIAAGNSGPQAPPENPANLASAHVNIIAVASISRNGLVSPFSSARPYVTIAAPGDEILTTTPGGTYGSVSGTSFSAPALAGVVALLLSAPGVQPESIKPALTATAKQPVGGPTLPIPNPQYGWGIVDAFAAYRRLAPALIITEPIGTGGSASVGGSVTIAEPIATLRPTIRFRVTRVPLNEIRLFIDGQEVQILAIEPSTNNTWNLRVRVGTQTRVFRVVNVTETVTDANGNLIPFSYEIVINDPTFGPDNSLDFSIGSHSIEIRDTVVGRSPGDIRNFIVAPKILPQGRSMISIPFFEDLNNDLLNDTTPESLFGAEFSLVRWIPPYGPYVFYSPTGPRDNGASFLPSDVITHFDGEATPRNPVGIGFWADFTSARPVLTRGRTLSERAMVIPLRGKRAVTDPTAWNMIGDPYPFDVPFNALLVDTPEGRLSIRDAADRGYLLPNLYSFDPLVGYTYRTLPDGALRAWEGHWIGVTATADLNLIVPPAALITTSPPPGRAAVSSDGWSMKLSASVRNLRDSFNFIGVSAGSSDSYDRRDVPKPPMSAPFVTVGIDHPDWGSRSGIYAQDVRGPGASKAWQVVVNTDQANSTVTVGWEGQRSLPRSVKMTLRDETTGQVVDMRTRSAYAFNTGSAPGIRKFTVSSGPAHGSIVRIANVNIQPVGRASGANRIGFTLSGDATYDVKIMSATGAQVGTVATRSASAGDVQVLWNGKDAAGRSVPAGTYIVQIRATGPDGESVKAIQPFAVLR